jgi:hypothetical protein
MKDNELRNLVRVLIIVGTTFVAIGFTFSNTAFALNLCGSSNYNFCGDVEFWLFPIIGLPIAIAVIIVLWKKVYNH